ncbi:MAG: class B sortase [Lachnospiraceae bacterium]|nr:class B sortase [Lachnospiraceae bacterium]
MPDTSDNQASQPLEFLEDMRLDAKEPHAGPGNMGRVLFFVAAFAVLALGIILVIRAVFSYRSARASYDTIRNHAVSTTDDPPALRRHGDYASLPEGAVLEIDFDKISVAQGTLIGWLHVPALDISYPVVQGEDNDYYLDHTTDGTANANGAIFMECENRPDFSDGNTFLYGHNSVDGSMFGRLHELSISDSYTDTEPYFYIYRPNGTVDKYRIYSYYYAETGSRSFVYFRDDASYDYYAGLTMGLSDRALDADFSQRGRIVTLATCYGGTGTEYRYLVHGILEDSGRAD